MWSNDSNAMKRDRRISQLCLKLAVCLVCALPSLEAVADEPSRRPNVLVILCDDLRWDALGCAGHAHLKTPHIDRLAAEGCFFSNAFCTTSLCSPSRASILSGMYAHTHGVTNNFTEYPDTLKSFPAQLQAAGYQTAYIGKYHMGEDNDSPRPGFDYFVTHKGQGKYFDTEFNFNGRERKVVEGYYTTKVTEMAEEWIGQQSQDKPWMLMLGHKAPHSFYLPEPKYEKTFDDVEVNYPHSSYHIGDKPTWISQRQTTWHGIYGPLFDWRKQFPNTSAAGVVDFARMVRAYWGTILSVDDSVGRLVEVLKSRNELENTIIVFMGDNGLLEGEHGMVDKRTMHEASIRIPLIIRAPTLGKDTDRKIDQQVLTVDIAPTICELTGCAPLREVHGKSMVALMQGETANWRDAWFYHYNYEKQFPYTPNVRGIRTDEWKYIHYPHGDGGQDRHQSELYNLKADPKELHNLIGEADQQPRIRQLQGRLAELMAATGINSDSMPIDEGVSTELPDQKIR